MSIPNEAFYTLLAEVVQNEGKKRVRVRRYPWDNDGTLRASVKVGDNLEHWLWVEVGQRWLRVV